MRGSRSCRTCSGHCEQQPGKGADDGAEASLDHEVVLFGCAMRVSQPSHAGGWLRWARPGRPAPTLCAGPARRPHGPQWRAGGAAAAAPATVAAGLAGAGAVPRPRPSLLLAPGREGRRPTAAAPRRRPGRPGEAWVARPAAGCTGLRDLKVEAASGGDDPCFADLGAAHGVGVDQGPLLHADRGVPVRSPLVELPGLLRGPDGPGGGQEPLGLGHAMDDEGG